MFTPHLHTWRVLHPPPSDQLTHVLLSWDHHLWCTCSLRLPCLVRLDLELTIFGHNLEKCSSTQMLGGRKKIVGFIPFLASHRQQAQNWQINCSRPTSSTCTWKIDQTSRILFWKISQLSIKVSHFWVFSKTQQTNKTGWPRWCQTNWTQINLHYRRRFTLSIKLLILEE